MFRGQRDLAAAQDSRSEGQARLMACRETGELVAMSVFQCPGAGFRKIEIGFTWVADRWQRSFVNTEMNYLS
jgi:hypothetical protein